MRLDLIGAAWCHACMKTRAYMKIKKSRRRKSRWVLSFYFSIQLADFFYVVVLNGQCVIIFGLMFCLTVNMNWVWHETA